MTRTYELADQKTRVINVRVSEDFFQTFAEKAAEVTGRTPTELARQVLERFVFEVPEHVTLLAEVLALRRLVVRGVLHPEADMTVSANALQLIASTDAVKVDKARAQLGLAQPTDGAQL